MEIYLFFMLPVKSIKMHIKNVWRIDWHFNGTLCLENEILHRENKFQLRGWSSLGFSSSHHCLFVFTEGCSSSGLFLEMDPSISLTSSFTRTPRLYFSEIHSANRIITHSTDVLSYGLLLSGNNSISSGNSLPSLQFASLNELFSLLSFKCWFSKFPKGKTLLANLKMKSFKKSGDILEWCHLVILRLLKRQRVKKTQESRLRDKLTFAWSIWRSCVNSFKNLKLFEGSVDVFKWCQWHIWTFRLFN